MLVIVWEYQVKPDMESQFERLYGPEGDWVKLFRNAPGFVRTDLLRHEHLPGRYMTLDYWNDAEDFTRFQGEFQAEYEALDDRCAPLTSQEILVGRYNITL
jgi:heme-degrading monooxygenase HmoA